MAGNLAGLMRWPRAGDLRQYRREKVDHVPIMSPIYTQPYVDADATQFGDCAMKSGSAAWPGLVQSHADAQPPYNKVAIPGVFEPQSYQRFLEAPGSTSRRCPPKGTRQNGRGRPRFCTRPRAT